MYNKNYVNFGSQVNNMINTIVCVCTDQGWLKYVAK